MIGWLMRVLNDWTCARCEGFHRRAQAAESAAAKAIRQNDHAQLWKTVAYLKGRSNRMREKFVWARDVNRACREKILTSGLVSTRSERFPEYREGNLDVLVDRLIARAGQHKGPLPPDEHG